MAENGGYNRWVPVVSRLLWQCYYRVLGLISFHGSISEAYEAAKWLSESLLGPGGNVYWIVENRVFRWDNVEISPDIFMNVWFFGTPRNTMMLRRGWWALYLLETSVKALVLPEVSQLQ